MGKKVIESMDRFKETKSIDLSEETESIDATKETETKLDYKKEFKDLYLPKAQPSVIQVPSMTFLMVDGKGNPNEKEGEYQSAVELLYGLSYTIKMSYKGSQCPPGYYHYVVPPLEGLWWLEDDESDLDLAKKERYCWTSMIRQPEFVTKEVLEQAIGEINRKKPQLETAKARLQTLEEGLCVQMMHNGPYDDEPKSLEMMKRFMEEQGLRDAIGAVLPDGSIRRHHEIYLNDPSKTASSKLKTVLRWPVERAADLY